MEKFFILVCLLHSAWISYSMPLTKKLVDLTYVLNENNHRYPGIRPFKMDDVKYYNFHNETFGQETSGDRSQVEEYSAATHLGTHMDSPSHFIIAGKFIEEILPEEFFAAAAVIDITTRAEIDRDAEATIEDLQQWEAGTGQNLNESIILIRTGWGRKWNDRDAYYGTSGEDVAKLHYPGLSPNASRWLVDNRHIKGIGIDTISMDRGQSEDFHSHFTLLRNGIFILENVANLEELPIYGAELYVFPAKIGNASGAPTRIVASIPRIIYN